MIVSDFEGLGYRGTTGMGDATVKILSELGAKVHVVDVQAPTAPHEAYYTTDLAEPAQVSATANALAGVGPIHFWFSCAGVSHTLGPVTCMLVNYVGARQLIEETLLSIADGAGIAIIASQAGNN